MSSRAPRRRLEPRVRRQQILDTATGLIAARGFHRLSLAEIAEAVGVTNGGLLHYYGSKADLLMAVLEQRDTLDAQFVRGERAAEADHSTDLLACRAELLALMRGNASQREIVRLYTVLSAEALDPGHPAHAFFQRRLERSRRLLREMAAAWHPDPESFAVQVLAFMDGLQLSWLRDPAIDVVAEWEAFADRLFPVRRVRSGI